MRRAFNNRATCIREWWRIAKVVLDRGSTDITFAERVHKLTIRFVIAWVDRLRTLTSVKLSCSENQNKIIEVCFNLPLKSRCHLAWSILSLCRLSSPKPPLALLIRPTVCKCLPIRPWIFFHVIIRWQILCRINYLVTAATCSSLQEVKSFDAGVRWQDKKGGDRLGTQPQHI